MKTISIKLLLEKIKKSDVNILGFVITPWHLIGMRAFIEKMKYDGLYKGHMILVGRLQKHDYVIKNVDETDLCVLKENEIPVLKESFFKKFRYLIKSQSLNDKDSLYIVAPWNYRFNNAIYLYKYTKRKCILCKIDEGVATYMVTSNALYQSLTTFNFKLFFRWLGRTNAQILLKRNMDCNLLIKRNGKLTPNQSILPFYRKVLNVENINIQKSSKDIVLATMAFPENEVYNDELTIKTGNAVSFLISKGFNVTIKPHPREENVESKYSSMGCPIAEKHQSIEEFLLRERPCAIISFSSTTLITAKLFYGIEPISLYYMLNLKNFSMKYRNELSTFRKTFFNVASFPKDYNELLSILLSVSNSNK